MGDKETTVRYEINERIISEIASEVEHLQLQLCVIYDALDFLLKKLLQIDLVEVEQ